MTLPASRGQLRASFLRWALLIVPAVMFLGFIGARLAGPAPGNPWFDGLAKPAIYPPPAAFGIVWPVLYLLMGVALTLVVTARGARGRGIAIAAFLVQFALNLAWTPIFFAGHKMTAALGVIVALDLAAIATIALFWRVRRPAALLLIPYLAWILFATLLNWEFLRANPGAEGQTAPAATTRFEI
ncbi:MAG TPA: TspO/MBR family protein [Novosphingobium sp.]|nr:TspO/MBR family protein [Novosphingobium sp.]